FRSDRLKGFRRFDFRRFGFDQLDDVVEHALAFDVVIGHARKVDHVFARAAAGDADVGLARFAWAVDDAAEHRERERRLDVLEPLLERLDGLDHVEALAGAAWARDDAHAAGPETERFQDLEPDAHFLLGLGRERNADRVADAGPQQVADADRTLDRAADQTARFGDAEVQRAIDRFGQAHVG